MQKLSELANVLSGAVLLADGDYRGASEALKKCVHGSRLTPCICIAADCLGGFAKGLGPRYAQPATKACVLPALCAKLDTKTAAIAIACTSALTCLYTHTFSSLVRV